MVNIQIAGVPLIIILGIVTLLFFLTATVIAVMNKKGNMTIPPKWHPRIAGLAIALAVIHAILVIMSRL